MSELWSRTTFVAVAWAYAGVLAWLAITLPERVPMHFNAAGNVDDWGSKTAALLLWTGLGIFILGGGALLARFATAGDGTWLNMPHKEYWLAPERRAEFRRTFEADTLIFVTWNGLLLIVMMLITSVAADGSATPAWWFWAGLLVYLAGTAAWVAYLLRRYRPPKDKSA